MSVRSGRRRTLVEENYPKPLVKRYLDSPRKYDPSDPNAKKPGKRLTTQGKLVIAVVLTTLAAMCVPKGFQYRMDSRLQESEAHVHTMKTAVMEDLEPLLSNATIVLEGQLNEVYHGRITYALRETMKYVLKRAQEDWTEPLTQMRSLPGKIIGDLPTIFTRLKDAAMRDGLKANAIAEEAKEIGKEKESYAHRLENLKKLLANAETILSRAEAAVNITAEIGDRVASRVETAEVDAKKAVEVWTQGDAEGQNLGETANELQVRAENVRAKFNEAVSSYNDVTAPRTGYFDRIRSKIARTNEATAEAAREIRQTIDATDVSVEAKGILGRTISPSVRTFNLAGESLGANPFLGAYGANLRDQLVVASGLQGLAADSTELSALRDLTGVKRTSISARLQEAISDAMPSATGRNKELRYPLAGGSHTLAAGECLPMHVETLRHPETGVEFAVNPYVFALGRPANVRRVGIEHIDPAFAPSTSAAPGKYRVWGRRWRDGEARAAAQNGAEEASVAHVEADASVTGRWEMLRLGTLNFPQEWKDIGEVEKHEDMKLDKKTGKHAVHELANYYDLIGIELLAASPPESASACLYRVVVEGDVLPPPPPKVEVERI